jgi:hypothetical protein
MGVDSELVVLWITGDREAALNMACMYAYNSLARGWWEEVTLIVWGPSARLLCQDAGLQEEIARLREGGVKLQACKACADRYEVAGDLERLGVEVRYMGQALTGYLQQGYRVLSV